MPKIDVLVARTVTFFMFTAIPMTGLSSAPTISDIIEIVDATKRGKRGQTYPVIAVGTEIETRDPGTATLIVTTGIITTDDENVEVGQEVIAMMIKLAKESDGIAVEVEVIPWKEIDLVELLPMENR